MILPCAIKRGCKCTIRAINLLKSESCFLDQRYAFIITSIHRALIVVTKFHNNVAMKSHLHLNDQILLDEENNFRKNNEKLELLP